MQEKIICGVHSCCATADNFVTATKWIWKAWAKKA